MPLCPYCKREVTLKAEGRQRVPALKRETQRITLTRKQVMFLCPHCDCVLGFSQAPWWAEDVV